MKYVDVPKLISALLKKKARLNNLIINDKVHQYYIQ